MNYIKRPLCATTNVRETVNITKPTTPMNNVVQFNDPIGNRLKTT